MSFPPATEMFQFAGFASLAYEFSQGYPDQVRGGLPHSEIPGSTIARISPGLFAACRVLHRLSVPRHPPDALCLARSRRRGLRPAPWGQAQTTSRNPAAHRGKPRWQACLRETRLRETRLRRQGPAAVLAGRQRAASLYEDTCPDGPPRRPGRPQACACRQPARCPRPVRLGHIRKSVLPVNQHRPGTPNPGNPEPGNPEPGKPRTREAGHRPPAAPEPEPNLVLRRMPFYKTGSQSRFRTPGTAIKSDLRHPISAVRSPISGRSLLGRAVLLVFRPLERGGEPLESGGERDRTDDLLLAKQALSQLSYTPAPHGAQEPGDQVTDADPRRLVPGPEWWAREDLNLRPHAYQARALTS